MPLLYFLYRKLGFQQAKDNTLKLFDLTVSLMLIGGVLGGLLGGLKIVASDGEIRTLSVLVSLAGYAFSLLGALYYVSCIVLLSVRAYQRKLYTPKLSMGIFEALRGKRDRQSSTTSAE